MKLVEVQAGTFPMGVALDEGCLDKRPEDPDDGPHWDEGPVHEVTITYTFSMSALSVTNEDLAH